MILGEQLSRYCVVAMLLAQYLLCLALVAVGAFGWPLLLVLVSHVPVLPRLFAVYSQPKPEEPPDRSTRTNVWPLWFSAYAFRHTRRFTSLFLLALHRSIP